MDGKAQRNFLQESRQSDGYRLRGEGREFATAPLSDEKVKQAEQKLQEALEIFREVTTRRAKHRSSTIWETSMQI